MKAFSLLMPMAKGRGRIALNEEPFRLFFPSGIWIGVVGVALWPLSIWGALPYYPGPAHARLMVGGFFGAMIIGFLGTAGPRMLNAPRLRRWELVALVALWGVAVGAALVNRLVWADGLTVGAFVFAFVAAARRFRRRRDLPPPGFCLVLLGLGAGMTGAAMNWAVGAGADWVPSPFVVSELGRLLFYQAFVLLPILGVAPFFFPRFGGLPNPQASYPELRRPTRDWLGRATLALLFGIGILSTYLLEAQGSGRTGGLVRAGFVFGYVLWQVPLRFPKGTVGTLGRVVQIAMGLLVAGMALAAAIPAYRVGLLHLVYIGGFNLIALAVANWVIFGHSGSPGLGRAKLGFVRWGAGLIVFALATRLSAELFADIRASHLAYAALAWIAGMGIWAWRMLPRVATPDAD